MYDIVVIGNPTFLMSSVYNQLSGPSVYSAATAAKLGIENLAIVGSVDESFRDDFIQSADVLGIPEYYIVPPDKNRPRQLRTMDGIEFLGVPREIGIKDIPDEFLQAQAILLSPSLQEINAELVEWICNSSDSLIFLKPQLKTISPSGQLEYIKELNLMEKTHCFIDIFQPDLAEASLITGESDPYLAAELLVDWATEICVLTMGDKGSLIYDGSEFHIIPPYLTDSVDSFGAGSVYLSGFAYQHISGASLSECGVYASSIASIKVENKGLDFNIDKRDLGQRIELLLDSVEIR
ncbi:MAG: carbohydrate kinase family protein [Candidatus Thorarchaeota archaeon]